MCRDRQQDRTAHLVLEIDGSVEVGDLGVDGLTDNLALAGMYELAHFCTAISTTAQDRTGQLERDRPSTVSGGPVDCWKPVRPPVGGQRWSAMAVGGAIPKPPPPPPRLLKPPRPPLSPPRPRNDPLPLIMNWCIGGCVDWGGAGGVGCGGGTGK